MPNTDLLSIFQNYAKKYGANILIFGVYLKLDRYPVTKRFNNIARPWLLTQLIWGFKTEYIQCPDYPE